MKNFFGWLMGGAKSAEKMVDAVINTGDKLVYTDEERAEARAKTREWFLQYLKATQPQNVSRRLIAVIVTGLWALLVLAASIAHFIDPKAGQFLFDVLEQNVNTPFLVILSFYFAAHVMRASKGG